MINTKGQKAQTAIELAVFGAILIFVLGATVSGGLNRGHQQHSILKATRMALSLSYKASNGLFSAGRNSASVLIVEDRLTAASNKYGAVDRVPYMMQGSGAHTANMMMPVDFGDPEDLPMTDVIVNGKHFSFTTAAFKTVQVMNVGGGSCQSVVHHVSGDVTSNAPCPEVEPNCIRESLNDVTTAFFSCPKLYTIMDNHPLIDQWCDNSSPGTTCPDSCTVNPVRGCNLAPAERFDLDRNDLDGVAGDVSVPASEWARFAWQWFLVMGYDERSVEKATIEQLYLDADDPAPFPVNELAMAEGINVDSGKHISLDVDNDLKLEQIVQHYDPDAEEYAGGVILYVDPDGETNGSIMTVEVRDFQEGDMDFTRSSNDLGPTPGFTRDVTTYTFVRGTGPEGGTYLEIDQGELFGAGGGQFIRTASKKDSIDVIERVYQLSNDTGRFCNGSTPQPTLERIGGVKIDGTISGGEILPNPVEVCGNCFAAGNLSKTCFDPGSLIIYMRSRVSDMHGRKWVTDTSDDAGIQFLQ